MDKVAEQMNTAAPCDIVAGLCARLREFESKEGANGEALANECRSFIYKQEEVTWFHILLASYFVNGGVMLRDPWPPNPQSLPPLLPGSASSLMQPAALEAADEEEEGHQQLPAAIIYCHHEEEAAAATKIKADFELRAEADAEIEYEAGIEAESEIAQGEAKAAMIAVPVVESPDSPLQLFAAATDSFEDEMREHGFVDDFLDHLEDGRLNDDLVTEESADFTTTRGMRDIEQMVASLGACDGGAEYGGL